MSLKRFSVLMGGLAAMLLAAVVLAQPNTFNLHLLPIHWQDGTAAAPSATFASDPDTGLYRVGANNLGLAVSGAKIADLDGTDLVYGATATGTSSLLATGISATSIKGGTAGVRWIEEEITLATGGVTTDSTANLLPANSLILGVGTIVTDTITTAVNFQVGDGTTADRFDGADTNVTALDAAVKTDHLQGSIASDATGPMQVAAAKLRITCNANPGAGKIRVTVFYMPFTSPTS